MISNVNNDGSNLMQLLMNAMKNSSNTNTTGSASGLSKDDLNSIIPSEKSPENGFLSCLQENFSKIDSNSDNQLSKDEVGTYAKENRPMGPPPGMFIENMQGHQCCDTKSKDDAASTDNVENTGKSHGEGRLQKVFNELDTNQDGTLSKEEIDAANAGITGQSTNQNNDNSVADVFSSIFSKLSNSSDFSKMTEQFTKKLTEAYGKQGSAGSLLSSAIDLAI